MIFDSETTRAYETSKRILKGEQDSFFKSEKLIAPALHRARIHWSVAESGLRRVPPSYRAGSGVLYDALAGEGHDLYRVDVLGSGGCIVRDVDAPPVAADGAHANLEGPDELSCGDRGFALNHGSAGTHEENRRIFTVPDSRLDEVSRCAPGAW